MALVQLDLEHADDISRLLETSWRSQFSTGSYPVFSSHYLRWVYGGPHTADNILLGYESGGRLVGFRAMLFRSMVIHGIRTRAHISTHLAVDPSLPLADRIDAVAALGEVHSYIHPSKGPDDPATGHFDTFVSFFDEAAESRRYQRATETRLANAGVTRAKIRFQPAMVHARRVRACLDRHAASSPVVEVASPDAAEDIAALFAENGNGREVVVGVSPDWVRHHLFGLATSRVYVSRRDKGLDGCLSCYALDTRAGDQTRRVVIIEYLLTSDPASAAALLAASLAFADEAGAKGVVLENTTYLDANLCSEVGLMPSTRRMVAAVACRSIPIRALPGLVLDVK